jgi:proteasome assembly chaperone (PAC2) family protein
MWYNLKSEDDEGRYGSMVICLSTSAPQYRELYSQARELASYLLSKMKFSTHTILFSSALGPEVIVEEGVARLPQCIFHAHKNPDFLLLTGDSSPTDEQFEFTDLVLSFASKLGVKEVYSVGARWTEPPVPPEAEPEVKGFSTDAEGIEKLKKHGVKIISNEPAPFFASMVVGLAKDYGMRGYKISVDHGEPRPHTRSVLKMLNLLSAMIGFEVDATELKDRIREMQERQGRQGTVYS